MSGIVLSNIGRLKAEDVVGALIGENALLTQLPFDGVCRVFVDRLEGANPVDLLETPYPLSLPCTLRQVGDAERCLG